MLFKGIIHVHSNLSYDGQHSLNEIAAFAKKRGYSFVGMSEHSDTLDAEKVAAYVKECECVSTPECLIIPGIEFTCENNLHLLGFGMKDYTDSKDPVEVAQFIQRNGGVAVVAHPKRYEYQIPPELVPFLNGIEVWNAGYDGRFVPNDRTLRLLEQLRRSNGSLCAFGGQDFHQMKDHSHVRVQISSERLHQEGILEKLRKGPFVVSNFCFRVSAGSNGRLNLTGITLARGAYELVMRIRNRVGSAE